MDTFYFKSLKRALDLIATLIILIFFLPFFLIIAVCIKVDSKGPVIFRQERVGKDLRLFTLFKFRSMVDKENEMKKIVGRDEGVTRVGYYLRRLKFDEFPQLINVLKGDMSIIGPRPGIQFQLEKMNEEELKRYKVRPGLTGLAQISGGIHIPWKERFVFDLIYIKNLSFVTDLRIIWRTLFVVILGEGKYLNRPLKMREP